MRFSFTGIDKAGSEINSTIDAESQDEAIAALREKGIVPSSIKPIPPIKSAQQSPEPAPSDDERVPCPACAEDIKPNASICPFCKTAIYSHNSGTNALIGIVVFVVAFILLYWGFTTWMNYRIDNDMEQIQQEANDAFRDALRPGPR